MKRAFVFFSLLCLAITPARAAVAAPKHPVCADMGPTFGVGVSRFSAVGNWDEIASTQYGAKWKYLYWYLLVTNDQAGLASWMLSDVQIARSINAIPVFTFYQLLDTAKGRGFVGSEAQIVQQGMQDPATMHAYFDQFIFILKTLTAPSASGPILVQVEPDSWGFMIWAMGVNGNNDATSVPAKVGGSGHPDVAGFADHAGGLGQALLKLRDQYAPEIRLGWHASNFRTGTGGDIVAQFYGAMGEWDLLFGEHPHMEGDPKQWWLPWDDAKVTQNLSFFSTLTSTTHLPILLWQEKIGTTDFHVLSADAADVTMRTRFAQAGIAGVLFSMSGSGNPDDFRADEDPDLATVPPPQSGAGGTAKDMRARVAAYTQSPLPWPKGSICGGDGGGGSGGSGSGGSGSGGSGSGGSGSGAGGSMNPGGIGGKCSFGGLPASGHAPWLATLAALAVAVRRAAKRKGVSRPRSSRS